MDERPTAGQILEARANGAMITNCAITGVNLQDVGAVHAVKCDSFRPNIGFADHIPTTNPDHVFMEFNNEPEIHLVCRAALTCLRCKW